jgi:DNA-binding NtrC family response regulator/predicted ATPase
MAQPRPIPPDDPTERLLGASPAIAALRAQLRHLAAFDTPGGAAVPTVLLQGETGTGKGLIARLLHDSGPRARGRFVEVNCAAIPEQLLEAELFGVIAGAFTDAKRTKPGLFEVASGGTLFLDEVDTLPLVLQGKLLTALEAKRVRPVGAVAEQPVDIKLTAATQADLGGLVEQGRFRTDLYFRLAVIPLVVPPLRARGEDVVLLAQHYLRWYAEAHGVHPKRLTRAAEAWLRAYRWPGNVRELSHLMERVILLHPDASVERQTLERLGLPEVAPAIEAAAHPPDGHTATDEPAQIRQALAQTRGNVAQAARRLGWTRKKLRYYIDQHAIDLPPRPRGRPPRTAPGEEQPALTPPEDPPAQIPSGEQKPVAILAIELTFPEAAGPIPAYEPWTVARRWTQTVVEKVRGFGGALVQQGPTLLLAAFGVPHTLEQLSQRAVQAALALRQLTAEGRVPGPGLRQAMHWGPVLVDRQAREPAQGLLPLGDTLALPVRLLGQAGPGEVVLSPTLARLVIGWYALEALPPPAGEGDPVKISAYRVRGLVPRRSPLAGLGAQALSPFVGRERELAVLKVLMAEVEAGRGQAVGVVGEPGVGKSRLLLEFRQRLAGQGLTYLEGRGLSYESTVPYRAVLELLRENFGITMTDAAELVADNVRRALQDVGMAPDEWAPYLLHLLGLPGATEQAAGLSPEALRQRTHETLWQLSLQGSKRRPLILAVEDLQWVDPSSEAFFAMLVERLAGAPILFFATYRTGHRPGWLERSHATQLVLPPLSPPDSQRVVQAVWQAVPSPAPVTQAILARAEGNPLFLEELTRAVLEQGEPLAASAVPDSLQGVLLARIDRLPPGARRALQFASVVGRECPLPLLEALWEGEPMPLAAALARLVEAELLYQQGMPPEATYRFKHALIQEAAYQTLPQGSRQQAHRQTAYVLETRVPETGLVQPERLAHHYTAAGLAAQAVPHWLRAGQHAIERSANLEAIQHFTTGLHLLATLPESPMRVQQELDLQLALGRALSTTMGPAAPEVEQTYAQARALCTQAGDTAQLFPTLHGLCRFYRNQGALPTARELGEQLLRLAQRETSPTLCQQAHDALGMTLCFMGDYPEAWTHLEQGIALTDATAQQALARRHGEASGVRCLALAAPTLWCLGYPAQAMRRGQEALALAREIAHPYSLAFAQFWTACLHHHRRDVPAVQAQVDALFTLATAQSFPFWMNYGTFWQGWVLTMQDQGEAGLTQMHQGMAAVLALGQALARPFCLVLLAEATGHAGHIDKGLCLLAEALTAMEESGRNDLFAEAYRLRGEFLLRQATPDTVQAEACYHQAIAMARRQQAKSWELRAAMSLGRLWQQQGKRTQAHQLLTPIYGWFTECFDTADRQEAKALLEAIA